MYNTPTQPAALTSSGRLDRENPAQPLVSAVVIFLNGERFLVEAVESILAQTYRNVEIVLVDDGSTDESPAVAARYADALPGRVRLLQHPGRENRGMSASRNLGVLHARGEYIAFLDCDDVWLAEKTAEQVAILEAHADVAMIYGRTEIWHTWEAGAVGARDYFYELGVRTEAVHPAPALLRTLLENRFQSPTTCNAMIRRSAYVALGGFEERFRSMYEDQAFFAKLYLRYPTYVSSRAWARYRQHGGNTGNHFSQARYYRDREPLMHFVHGQARAHWPSLDRATRSVVRREFRRANNPLLATALLAAGQRWQRLKHRFAELLSTRTKPVSQAAASAEANHLPN